MNTLTNIVEGSYLQLVAWNLVLRAKSDRRFMEVLMKQMDKKEIASPWAHGEDLDDFAPDGKTLTISISSAISKRKLAWLLNEIDYVDVDERSDVLRILRMVHCNASPLAQPQPGIYGTFAGFRDGSTLGEPDPIRGLEYSQVIIHRKDAEQFDQYEFARALNNASTDVLMNCIEAANYDFQRLEPEVVSWLSDSRMLEIYCVDNASECRAVLDAVRRAGIKFSLVDTEGLPTILALQPSVTGDYYKLVEGLSASK